MDIRDLCEQKLVDNTFMPIKEKLPNLKEDIEEIEFLFKNAHYNRNRMIEEMFNSLMQKAFNRELLI